MNRLARRDRNPARVPAAASVAPALHYNLAGHSGARVTLIADGVTSFVRKKSAGPAGNARFRLQVEKQRRLRMLGLPLPRVIAEDTDANGHATFDMEYIAGRTVADAVLNAAPFDYDRLTGAVERMMRLFILMRGAPLPPRVFRDKIETIAEGGDAGTRAAARRLLGCDWEGIPESPCHGDLTLENILLTARKDITFIDCDHPWVSSYWLDFGKLFQDLSGHWCVRALYDSPSPEVRRVNAVQKLDQLGRDLHALAGAMDGALPARLPQLAALNLFRALPYVESAVPFVCGRIARLLDA